MRIHGLVVALIALASSTHAAQWPVSVRPPDDLGAPYVEFKSQVLNDTKLRFVKNSGVCETTPGVNQLSGYIDVGTNMSMWFWFFEARHEPETAPFTVWEGRRLNGGPGCSSMIGLFQEHGPCQVNADGQTTILNPHSWNNLSNIIYIDQPIGTGFSYGTIDVNSTFASSPAVWTAFQILFESRQFAQYQSREFILATESYGGHYGPEFVTYFNQQNELIRSGASEGELIEVSALMINNGWFDPLIQNKAYVDFATFAPGYGQLQNDTVLAALNESHFGEGGCRDRELACYAAGDGEESDRICREADEFCIVNVFAPAVGGRDPNDLRQNGSSSNPFPPSFYLEFLQNETILQRIGAQVRYSACSGAVGHEFSKTGDDARSLLPQLSALADVGMKILIWAGDADINCNWLGGYESILAMNWYGNEALHNAPFTNMTVHGMAIAAVQNVDNFSFARVFHAGHLVPAFQPEASFEIFRQIARKEQLHSVP